jgi:hypothetical protein
MSAKKMVISYVSNANAHSIIENTRGLVFLHSRYCMNSVNEADRYMRSRVNCPTKAEGMACSNVSGRKSNTITEVNNANPKSFVSFFIKINRNTIDKSMRQTRIKALAVSLAVKNPKL